MFLPASIHLWDSGMERHRQRLIALALSVLILVASDTAVRFNIGVASAIPVFMLFALLAAWQAGWPYAVFVTLASTAGLDFFFTEPKYNLRVYSIQDAFALISFGVVSLYVSHLAQRVRTERMLLENREQEQRSLYELSQGLLLIDWKAAPEEEICRITQERLHLDGVAFWDEETSSFWAAGEAGETREMLHAACRAQRDYDLKVRKYFIRVLYSGTHRMGAVLFQGDDLSPLLVGSVSALLCMNLEKLRAQRAELLAESAAMSEKLRSAVLDGLAHEVKTPLTTIAVSGAGMRELGTLNELQLELASTIETQALRLASVTDQLLRTSRLTTEDVILHRRLTDLRDLCETALGDLPADRESTRILVDLSNYPVLVDVDPTVLRMALVQLLDNAVKYSPADSQIQVTVYCDDSEAHFSVHNTGSYIKPDEQPRIFERYYRSAATEQRAPGIGLGLSVARRVVTMHGGSLGVESDRDAGTTFHVTLPSEAGCK